MTGGVSAAVGLVCLVAAALIWTVGRRHTPRLVVALVIAGMVGVLGTPMGNWVRQAVGYLDQVTGAVTGRLTGVVLTGLVAGIALYVVVVHLTNKSVDTKTLIAAAIVPVAVSFVPGVVGDVGAGVINAVASGMAMVVGAAFGVG